MSVSTSKPHKGLTTCLTGSQFEFVNLLQVFISKNEFCCICLVVHFLKAWWKGEVYDPLKLTITFYILFS